jgi:hypothetical protein
MDGGADISGCRNGVSASAVPITGEDKKGLFSTTYHYTSMPGRSEVLQFARMHRANCNTSTPVIGDDKPWPGIELVCHWHGPIFIQGIWDRIEYLSRVEDWNVKSVVAHGPDQGDALCQRNNRREFRLSLAIASKAAHRVPTFWIVWEHQCCNA